MQGHSGHISTANQQAMCHGRITGTRRFSSIARHSIYESRL